MAHCPHTLLPQVHYCIRCPEHWHLPLVLPDNELYRRYHYYKLLLEVHLSSSPPSAAFRTDFGMMDRPYMFPEFCREEVRHFDLGVELQRRIAIVLSRKRCCFVPLFWTVGGPRIYIH
jgi:hypothetical protein